MKSGGFTLIEVMVTVTIVSIGLLGLAGLQGRGLMAQKEAYQRAQALALLHDMAGRIQANRVDAKTGAYVAIGSETRGTGFNASNPLDCSGLAASRLDLCEWHNALLGTGTGVSALVGTRGCVEPLSDPNLDSGYRVVVAWQGFAATAAPSVACGHGSYGDDARRRVATIHVSVPLLD